MQIKNKYLPLHRFRKIKHSKRSFGEVAEWSIAAVLKTVVLRGTGGSNPSLSAINAKNQQITKQTPNFTPNNVKLGVFFFRIIFKLLVEYLVYNINLFIFAINSRWREKMSLFNFDSIVYFIN